MDQIWKSLLFILIFVPALSWSDAQIELKSAPSTVRIGPVGEFHGDDAVEIFSAKNEIESFQVAVTARGGNLENLNVEITTLKNTESGEIPLAEMSLFREIDVPVRYSSPRAVLPPGWIPDPLAPFYDPYTGESFHCARWRENKMQGSRFGAAGFDVWQDQHQRLWVDVRVPAQCPAGIYEGEMRVTARNAKAAIPVRLHVWDFALPDGPSHENHFGGFSGIAGYYKIERNSERYQQLEDRYIALMAEHRLNPPLPSRYFPRTAEDGSIVMEDENDRQIAEFVHRYHLTNLEIPRAPFRDILGENRSKAIQYYRSWFAYLQKKGWERGAYLYMLDEPNTSEAYEQVRQLGALVKEANPGIRRLVVEQPYAQNPQWGALDGSIDIWCPLFAFIDESSVRRVQSQGDEVWSYSALVQSAPSYHPSYENVKNDNPPYWQLDFPALSYRIAPWLNRRYGVTGLLYWSTVYWGSPDRDPWDDPGFRIRWNGDGFLFYPGVDAGVDGPVASIRLKNLRDGMEDYEYFQILDRQGKQELVQQIVTQAVPTWGTWNQNPMQLLELRKKLAEAILQK
ncbi:MAG: glycoside hydrolase domain-containing protein [Candidatus Omnitrophota bacterium]